MTIFDRLKAFLSGGARPTFGELHAKAIRTPDEPAGEQDPPNRSPVEAVKPTREFELVRDLLKEGCAPFVLVIGQAGTGKTTCINWLREQVDGNVVVVAFTGLAALTAGGQTIHSFFRFPPKWLGPRDIELHLDPAIYQELDVLVIDEISMVRVDLLDAIDRFLRLNRSQRNPANANRPFGGAQIVAFGDLFQLPPVVTRGDQRLMERAGYLSQHFFSAEALRNLAPATVELTQPFRQRDSVFLGLLGCIREDRDTERAVEELNARCAESGASNADIWLTVVPTRARAERVNFRQLDVLPSEPRTYQGQIRGRFISGLREGEKPNDTQEERNLPAPFELQLKPGARVIFTKNDGGHQWVNGTMGTVVATEPEHVVVRVDADGEGEGDIVHVGRSRWTKDRYQYDRLLGRITQEEVGSYSQIPLAPAWAITIHKVQGQTLDRICVDLDRGAFATGQTYVAISRCRSLDGLRLARPITREDVLCDPQVRRFMDSVRPSLANRLLVEEGSTQDEPYGPAGENYGEQR